MNDKLIRENNGPVTIPVRSPEDRIKELEAQVVALQQDCEQLVEVHSTCSADMVAALNTIQELEAEVARLREALWKCSRMH